MTSINTEFTVTQSILQDTDLSFGVVVDEMRQQIAQDLS